MLAHECVYEWVLDHPALAVIAFVMALFVVGAVIGGGDSGSRASSSRSAAGSAPPAEVFRDVVRDRGIPVAAAETLARKACGLMDRGVSKDGLPTIAALQAADMNLDDDDEVCP